MANTKKQNKPIKKLLDLWIPPQEAGDPVGCIATSYTFNPVFFEEECLGRFVKMESHPAEDGPVYLIEREEKLNSISCAAALVDHHHCKGNRSLRWDVVPVRLTGRIFHPKIALLCWSNYIRLLVGSANITDDGYRRNQEIFANLDFSSSSNAHRDCLAAILQFMRNIIRKAGYIVSDSPATGRCLDFLAQVQKKLDAWSANETAAKPSRLQFHTILSGLGSEPVLEQIQKWWGNGSPPSRAEVISPFYNLSVDDAPDGASRALWKILKQRGAAEIVYNTTVHETDDGAGVSINAPYVALKRSVPPNRSGLKIAFSEMPEDFEADKDNDWGYRPLHMKSLWIENDQRACLLVGSSNFTNAGMGLNAKGRNNFEANLLYAVDRKGKEWQALRQCFPAGKPIEESRIVGGESTLLQSEDSISEEEVLPLFFCSALYTCRTGQQPSFRISFDPSKYDPELSGWVLIIKDKGSIYTEKQWFDAGKPTEVSIACTISPPPSGFTATWERASKEAWWPLIIDTQASLPPPDELKNLPLEILINVLSSARPIHQVLKSWVKRREQKMTNAISIDVDPHKRIDVSGFILQRTRRVSWALSELRKRLERPAATCEQLQWRLRGPIGVEALARAIIDEARSDQEKIFLITELALELDRVKPVEVAGCLESGEIKAELKLLIEELRAKVYEHDLTRNHALQRYVENVFRMISR